MVLTLIEYHNLIAYFLAFVIGLIMGIMGAGGGIMAVPILVYLLDIEPILATTNSLFIVGITSLVGSANYMRWQLVNYKTAILFALHSFLAVFLTRNFLLPAIPLTIFEWHQWKLTKEVLILGLFALIMIFSAYNMIKSNKHIGAPIGKPVSIRKNYPAFLLKTSIVGVVTGLVGAGGGFLIVPALVLLMRLPMKNAIGTSLFIISLNSIMGFFSSLGHQNIHWSFLIPFSAVAVVGVLMGSHFSKYLPANHLKTAFGWFVLLMGVAIFIKELFFDL
ncbi:MAG: sulfite exporter TauE/SafE family protein [Flammeovirgaceae bacterium]